MNKAKNNILSKIELTNTVPTEAIPIFPLELTTQYDSLIDQFINITKLVGANIHLKTESEPIDQIILQHFPKVKFIAGDTNKLQLTIINRPVQNSVRAHDLHDIDLAVIHGSFGVAENGAIWINQTEQFRALYFIAESLVIILDRKNLVPLMHEAYRKIHFSELGFGVFISGPSKTADIEQSLVIGAHGPGETLIILT